MSVLDKVRVGIIGCGEHASENLIPSLWSIPFAEVIATCDLDQRAAVRTAAKFPGAKSYLNFGHLLEGAGVQAIVAAASPQVHLKAATQALNLGIHVFVEKPPTVTTRELIGLAELAERSDLVTMVGHNLRHTTASMEMRSIVSDPNFGTPESMEVRYFASKPRGDRWGLGSPLRSFLLSHVNHALDLMIFQVGQPKIVESGATESSKGAITLTARFDFEKGGVGTLFASTNRPHFAVHATVLGEDQAYAVMDSLHGISGYGFAGDQKRRGRNWIERQLDAGYQHAGYQTELELFLKAVSSEVVAHPSFADEIPVYKVIDQIERQITGRRG